MSFTAIVENDTIKLPPGISLPDGARVVVLTPAESSVAPTGDDPLFRLAEHTMDDVLTDAARRHDDYLY